MDPLSVSMAIVGLLTAAQQISSAIGNLVSKSKSAPTEMQNVKSTVDTIRAVVLQLQMLLLGRAKVDPCVTTISELNVFVKALDSDDMLGLMDRVRWATKTKIIQEHLHKLEMHKSSLTLMMTILTCESTYKAEDAVDDLSIVIRQVLDNHQVLAQRMQSIEIKMSTDKPLTSHFPETSEYVPETIQRNAGGFAFEEALQNSWVYKRSDRKGDSGAFSVISSAGRTASWSMLSGLSLSDNILIIAVQAIPVYAYDLSNSDVYQFGEFNDSGVEIESDATDSGIVPEPPQSHQTFRGRFSKLTTGLAAKIPRKTSGDIYHPPVPPEAIPVPNVFGVPLRQSITYANVAISLMDEHGKTHICGYVPIVVVKVGVYLKEKATNVENIFSQSGSAKRVHELEVAFDTPGSNGRYGKGLDWAGYSVFDAASCLLRYLRLLPEPVIPLELYDRFTTTTVGLRDDKNFNLAKGITTLQELIITLPPLNRMLLLYLLDLLAVFAFKADENLMTSSRLVAAFQPALLSRRPDEMSAEDHSCAAETMILMIENQDYFLIGMRGTAAKSDTEQTAHENTMATNDNIDPDTLE